LDALAEALLPQSQKVVIAAIDCDQHKKTCGSLKLAGYPTVMLYKRHEKAPLAISDSTPRTAIGLAEFLVAKTGIKFPFTEPQTPVMQLKALNYENVLKDKFVLVKFATEWCGFCKKLAPVYENLALAFKGDEDKVVIAEVDCTNNADICDRYEIKGYPTLVFFKHSLEPSETYNGGRDLESMVSYVNKQCGLSRKSDGTLLPVYARIPAIDSLVLEFMKNKEKRSSLAQEIEQLVANAPEYDN
jgi:protein disulfide-isomerase A6